MSDDNYMHLHFTFFEKRFLTYDVQLSPFNSIQTCFRQKSTIQMIKPYIQNN